MKRIIFVIIINSFKFKPLHLTKIHLMKKPVALKMLLRTSFYYKITVLILPLFPLKLLVMHIRI